VLEEEEEYSVLHCETLVSLEQLLACSDNDRPSWVSTGRCTGYYSVVDLSLEKLTALRAGDGHDYRATQCRTAGNTHRFMQLA